MPLSSQFTEALAYAADLHRQQVRKGSQTPYIAHLLAVTAMVLEHGGDEETAIAAVLHDAVEDQGGEPTRVEIERRFGPRVVGLVMACTDTDLFPKPPWRERKERHLAKLEMAPTEALLITAADKLHNASSVLADYRRLGEQVWIRFTGGRDGTLWYYRSILEILRSRGPSLLVQELDAAVEELESLASQVPHDDPLV